MFIFRCKGTTKNAHTQVKLENIYKNNRFISTNFIRAPSRVCARLFNIINIK